MTELEQHLLTALKRLEHAFAVQAKSSLKAQEALSEMFEHTKEDNTLLREQVKNLSEQVSTLSELCGKNRR